MAALPLVRLTALPFSCAVLFGALLFAVSCGGLVEEDTPKPPNRKHIDDPQEEADAGSKDAGKNTKPPKDAGKDASGDADNTKDALPDYVDPGCPDTEPPIPQFECDPYKDNCGTGKTCYPFIETSNDPCEQEVYGASCIFAGSAGQGEPCGAGCKSGHVCVLTGQGTQCVKMCDLNNPNPCKDGLTCTAVDIPGIGGCI